MILYLKYTADIWVEVDTVAEEVLDVVVDESSMAHPVGVRRTNGLPGGTAEQRIAEEIANGIEWPSWDYSPNPGPRQLDV